MPTPRDAQAWCVLRWGGRLGKLTPVVPALGRSRCDRARTRVSVQGTSRLSRATESKRRGGGAEQATRWRCDSPSTRPRRQPSRQYPRHSFPNDQKLCNPVLNELAIGRETRDAEAGSHWCVPDGRLIRVPLNSAYEWGKGNRPAGGSLRGGCPATRGADGQAVLRVSGGLIRQPMSNPRTVSRNP